jgi:hypothetical protein
MSESSRITFDDWAPVAQQVSTLLSATFDAADTVFEVKLTQDGWGYGHSLVGTITSVGLERAFQGARELTPALYLTLTEDSDPERIGYNAGETVHVELGNAEWMEARQ